MSSGRWTCPQVSLGALLYRCMRVCHHLHPSAEGPAAAQVGWLGSVFQQKRGVELLVEVRCLHPSILFTLQGQLQVRKNRTCSGSTATGTYLDVEEVPLAYFPHFWAGSKFEDSEADVDRNSIACLQAETVWADRVPVKAAWPYLGLDGCTQIVCDDQRLGVALQHTKC